MTREERARARAEAKRWREVATHIVEVEKFATALDAEMKQPSTPERGSRIAKLLNALEWSKDHVKHFTLGMELGKPAAKQLKLKRKAAS